MRRARRVGLRIGACAVIATACGALAAIGDRTEALSGFRERANDSVHPRGELDPSVVVVGIDDRALAEHGPWPWPRSKQAELLERIAASRPRVAAVDIVYAPEAEGDELLGHAVGSAPTVVTGLVSIGGADGGLLVADAATPPVPAVADHAAGVGHAAVAADANDGVVRSVPLVVDVDGSLVPSLAVAALAIGSGTTADVIVRPDAVQVGPRSIPTDDLHRLRVSWPEGLDDSVVSAADVLDGSVDQGVLADKVVLIGVVDPSVGDVHPTPVASSGGQPGVILQAAAYNTMATRAYLQPAAPIELALWVFTVVLLVALLVQFAPVWSAVVGVAVVVIGSTAATYVRADRGVIGDFVYPLVAIALAVPASGGVRYVVEVRHRREVSRLFARYVPPSVAERLIDDGQVESVAAGQRLDVSVLFCDLRGFTALSAALDPVEVNDRLAIYYEYASTIVLDHGGTLMQYVGDEVYAVFGAPVADAEHAAKAVASAKQLQEDAHRLDAQLAASGAPPLQFGIGVNSGEVVAVHTGSSHRRQYTAIGDAVNIGARLCSQAGPGQVFISDATRRRIDPQPLAVPTGPLTMKGVRDDFVAWKLVLHREASGSADRDAGVGS